MKKTAHILISLILCLALLCGCAGPAQVAEVKVPVYHAEEAPELSSFSELEYRRPDVDRLQDIVLELDDALKNPLDSEQVLVLLVEFFRLHDDFETMFTLAYIQNCRNVRDEFYAAEYSWLSGKKAEVDLMLSLVFAMSAKSVHGQWIDDYFLGDGFSDALNEASENLGEAEEDGDFYGRYTELAGEEAMLLAAYAQLMNDPDKLPPPGDAAALEQYYREYNAVFAEIYAKLILNRRQQAELKGYSSYPAMAYKLSFGRDYSPEEAELFLGYVKEHLAPLGRRAVGEGVWIDSVLAVPGERDHTLFLETAAEGFGGGIEQAYDFMRSRGLYDLEKRDNKVASSFVTSFEVYNAPYLFVSPLGEAGDLMTVFHEFGHYADIYIRQGAPAGMDLSECFSQAMQFLCIGELENVLSAEELDELRTLNILDMVDAYLTQSALAEFELRAYEMEEPDAEKLNALWLQLSIDYGIYDEADGAGSEYLWVDVPHLFESPFYVISYPVSAGVALELYELELEREGAGAEKFVQMSESALFSLRDTIEYAGLHDPLSEERIEAAAKIIETVFE